MSGPAPHGVAVAAVLVGLTLPLVGCQPSPSSGDPIAESPLPPRPAAVDVSGRRPCDLVDGTRLAELGLDAGRSGEVTINGRRSPTCTYLGRTPKIDSSVQFLPVPAADLALAPGATLDSLAGYGTVRSSDRSETLPGCDVVVDIADDTSLRTQSQALATNLRRAGLTDSALCDRSQELANVVLAELTAR